MRNYAFTMQRERSISQLFESSRWSKLQAFVFREWRALQINLCKARVFREETLLSQVFVMMKYSSKKMQRERELGKVCQIHLSSRQKRKILIAWNQYAKGTKVVRDARLDKFNYMRQYKMSMIIKAWFNTIDLLKNEVQITNHALNTRDFRVKKYYLMAWLSAYRGIEHKRKRLKDLK